MNTSSVSAKAVVKVLFVILAFALLLLFVKLTRNVLIWIFIALFLSLALGPAVESLSKRKVPRALAIFIVYIGMLLTIFGIGLLVVPPVVKQLEELADNAPQYAKEFSDKNGEFKKYDRKYHISQELSKQLSKLPEKLGSAATTLSDVTVTVFTKIVALVTILVMAFFLLQDGGKWWSKILSLQPSHREERMRQVGADIYKAVGGYVNGNLLISAIAGLLTWITLSLLNVPFAVPLAVFMAFMDLIPLVGATIGGVTIAIVTAFVDFPTALIVWVAALIVYQQLENHVLQPQIYKRAVHLHPLLVIIAILIGASLLGVLGALVAIPVAAAAQLIIKDLWLHRDGADARPIADLAN